MYFAVCAIEAPPTESKVGIPISLVTVITPRSVNEKSPGTDVYVIHTIHRAICPDTAGRRGGKKGSIIYEQQLLLMDL